MTISSPSRLSPLSHHPFPLVYHLITNNYTIMRIALLSLPLLASPALAFITADKALSWAGSLVSSSGGEAQAQVKAGGKVHTFDSWSYTDCGESSTVESVH